MNLIHHSSSRVEEEEKKEPELIEKCGVKFPKLDFTQIFMQREVVSSQNEDSDSEENQESYYVEG